MGRSLQRWTGMAMCALAMLSGGAGAEGRTVTLESLLREMVDREAVARWPQPHYVCKQASSYDRTQTDPTDRKTWFANKDYEQFIRIDERQGRREWVILEHEGPGCITRYWTPNLDQKKDQVIRFYLDGAETPTIEANYLDLLNGRGFIKPPFAFTSVRAGNLYLPIPFARGCRITLDSVPFYYNINYRAYDPGTSVRTFTRADFDAAERALERVGRALAERTQGGAGHEASARRALDAGDHLSLDLPAGPAAVRLLEVKLSDPTPQTLRSTVLEMACDDEPTVWCPVGDFFGCPLGIRPFSDWYRAVAEDGTLTCRWVMPYRESARVILRNLGRKRVTARVRVLAGTWRWDDRSLYFRSNWRQQYPLKTRPMSDWNYLEAEGQGVYVGDGLLVMNPVPDWWGEGDEKVYVDGESFPSHLGTGTEDYYGTAWGLGMHYDCPFFATVRDTPNEGSYLGYSVPSRVRMLDAVPFRRSLRFDMEVWNWADTEVAYAVATYWYARPGATSNSVPQPEEATRELPKPPPPHKVAGALECEELQVADRSPDFPLGTQSGAPLASGRWSGGTQLFAQAKGPGDFLVLRIPAKEAVARRLTLHATQSYDYGILRFSVNGQPVAATFDGFSPEPKASGPIDLGVFVPREGRFDLRVEVVGANPSARGTKSYFGLDCVVLSPP